MPVPTVEQLQGKLETLRKTLADKGESLDAAKRRELKKKVRRVQRKTRRLATASAKVERETAKSAQPAAAAESPAESAPATPAEPEKQDAPADAE